MNMDNQKQFVAYYRVSSKRQKEEGVSLEAQKKLIKDYILRSSFKIIKEFEIDESAKKANRKIFYEMLAFVRDNPQVSGIISEKIDRLLRGNLKDRVLIEDLINDFDKEIHFVKEGLVLSKDSKSAEKLHFDIQNALARHYLNNLSDEVKKGYDVLVADGFYPHIPPIGYKSKLENHLAVVDQERAPFIKKAFELCATGEYTERKIGLTL
jgi:DNA invertase Pin-like site-specific DNA recombinase